MGLARSPKHRHGDAAKTKTADKTGGTTTTTTTTNTTNTTNTTAPTATAATSPWDVDLGAEEDQFTM